ncbi:MAG: hypothetical protein ABIP48_15685 [Planctomycetota bacterium]
MTMRQRGAWVVAVLWATSGGFAVAQDLGGGMVDPGIDTPGEPFSYFRNPTDVIGALYAPVASEVTPEGYIYTGFGELMFFVGNPAEPVNVRIKTLHQGYLPIVEYHLVRHGVRFRFTLFAADLGGPLAGQPVNFVKVELANATNQERAALLSSAYRFAAPKTTLYTRSDYRFGQRMDLIPKELVAGQTSYNPAWVYSFTKRAVVRDGRMLYLFPTDPQPHLAALSQSDYGLRTLRYLSGEVQERSARQFHTAETPMGLVMYRVPLKPGETRDLVFKMPLVPLVEDSEEAQLVEAADYQDHFSKTISTWENLVGKAPPLTFPETKVQEYLLANTVFDLLAIDKLGDDYAMNVNKFQYHRYYPGNAANMIVALDYMGLADIAQKCLLYARNAQQPDGRMENPHAPQSYRWENNGYVLWAWGRHYQLTEDRPFLEEVYPRVAAVVAWVREKSSQDPLGLMPPVALADDAMLAGVRQTGQNVWILIGLVGAIRMAEAMNRPEDVEAFRAVYQRYRNAFEKALATQLTKSDNVITPALEGTTAGNHWDNLLLLYPEPLFEPFDPRVTATIRHSRATYLEGILPFILPLATARRGVSDWPDTSRTGLPGTEDGDYVFQAMPSLHYWQTPNNAQNALVRGTPEDQQAAVEDLYALLLHTTSTHAPQEFGTVPWGTRDCGYHRLNLLPDGAASAKTIELLRNMVLREYEGNLVLLSALSPDWLQPGKTIETTGAPTDFGPVSLRLVARDDGFDLGISSRFRNSPKQLAVRVPWFFELESAEADGQPAAPVEGQLILPSGTREVKVRGTIRPDTPPMSFEKAVERYKQEYKRRYDEFLRTGVRPS